jgi:Uma2 family endonuclease
VGADDFLRASGAGCAFIAPGDLELDPETLVQPDVYVLPLVQGRRPREQSEIGRPLLVIEVLAPSTERFDRVIKRRRYQRAGVECWIVDLDARLVERWTPNADRPAIHIDTMTWQPSADGPTMTLTLAPLFTEALGEP